MSALLKKEQLKWNKVISRARALMPTEYFQGFDQFHKCRKGRNSLGNIFTQYRVFASRRGTQCRSHDVSLFWSSLKCQDSYESTNRSGINRHKLGTNRLNLGTNRQGTKLPWEPNDRMDTDLIVVCTSHWPQWNYLDSLFVFSFIPLAYCMTGPCNKFSRYFWGDSEDWLVHETLVQSSLARKWETCA